MIIYTIIVTYNAIQWIEHCLDCLSHSTIPTTPIVIDNGSTDGTRNFIPTHYPQAVWLPQDKNLGFGQGNNVGIRYAIEHQADYVLLLNQDAYLHADAIELMLKANKPHSLISPVHLNGDGTKLDSSFRYLISSCEKQHIIDEALIRHTVCPLYAVGMISAACWFIPASVLKEIGGFNPLFFHYGEDDNFHQRIEYHGIKTYLVTDAYICHDRGEHGNLKVFNRKRLHRDMLRIACNINWGGKKRSIQYLKLLVDCYHRFFSEHSYVPGSFLYEFFWLIFHYIIVSNSRQQEKQKGLVWL